MGTWRELEQRANERLARGELNEAAQLLLEAIELAPKEPALYRQLIQLTLLGGATETAVSAAVALRALEPRSAEAAYLLGVAQMAHGDFVAAEGTLDAAVKLAPKSWQVRQAQAQVARALKKNGRASQALEEAVALAPTEPAVVRDYATLLHELGESRQAKEVLTKALKTHAGDGALHLLLARVLVELDQSFEAAHHAKLAAASDDLDARGAATALLGVLEKR